MEFGLSRGGGHTPPSGAPPAQSAQVLTLVVLLCALPLLPCPRDTLSAQKQVTVKEQALGGGREGAANNAHGTGTKA